MTTSVTGFLKICDPSSVTWFWRFVFQPRSCFARGGLGFSYFGFVFCFLKNFYILIGLGMFLLRHPQALSLDFAFVQVILGIDVILFWSRSMVCGI